MRGNAINPRGGGVTKGENEVRKRRNVDTSSLMIARFGQYRIPIASIVPRDDRSNLSSATAVRKEGRNLFRFWPQFFSIQWSPRRDEPDERGRQAGRYAFARGDGTTSGLRLRLRRQLTTVNWSAATPASLSFNSAATESVLECGRRSGRTVHWHRGCGRR